MQHLTYGEWVAWCVGSLVALSSGPSKCYLFFLVPLQSEGAGRLLVLLCRCVVRRCVVHRCGGVVIEEYIRPSGPWLVRRPLPGSRASEPTSLRRPDCDDDDGRTTANWLGASASGQATSHGHMQILNFISPVVSSAMGMRVTPDAVTWAGLSFHNNG